MKYLEKHPMLMIIAGIIGISLSAILVKYAEAPAVVIATCRLLWTTAIMTPFVIRSPEIRKELKQTKLRNLLLGSCSGIFLALHFIFWFESLNQTSVASSTAIVCTEVIWVALGFCLFLKGRLSKAAVISIAITVVGSLLIALSDYSSGGNHLLGDGLALAAAIFVAIYTLITLQIRKSMTTASYTYVVYISCTVVLCLVTLFSGQSLTGHGSNVFIVGFLLAVFSTLLGHSLFTWCLKFLSPSFVSASKLCEPVVAAIFAAILFHEIPTPLQIIGGLITIGGVLLYSRVEQKERG